MLVGMVIIWVWEVVLSLWINLCDSWLWFLLIIVSGMFSRVLVWQMLLIMLNSSSGQYQLSQWMVQLWQVICVLVLNVWMKWLVLCFSVVYVIVQFVQCYSVFMFGCRLGVGCNGQKWVLKVFRLKLLVVWVVCLVEKLFSGVMQCSLVLILVLFRLGICMMMWLFLCILVRMFLCRLKMKQLLFSCISVSSGLQVLISLFCLVGIGLILLLIGVCICRLLICVCSLVICVLVWCIVVCNVWWCFLWLFLRFLLRLVCVLVMWLWVILCLCCERLNWVCERKLCLIICWLCWKFDLVLCNLVLVCVRLVLSVWMFFLWVLWSDLLSCVWVWLCVVCRVLSWVFSLGLLRLISRLFCFILLLCCMCSIWIWFLVLEEMMMLVVFVLFCNSRGGLCRCRQRVMVMIVRISSGVKSFYFFMGQVF